MTVTGREDDENHQQQLQELDEERRGNIDTLRDQLPSIRIQTQLLHLSSASPPRQQQQQQQRGQDTSGGVAVGGGGSSGMLLSAQSDMSDRTVFDWQVQDHHRHYSAHPTPSSFPGGDDRHATPGIEIRHGKDKDKWISPLPLPLLLSTLANQEPKHQYQNQQHLTTPYQQQQQNLSGSSTAATPSRNWAQQARRWLRRYLSISTETTPSHHHHHANQHSPVMASDDSPLASALSSTSTSTLVGERAVHSRHHPYFQGHRHSTSTSSTSSSATFLSPGDMESAKQYKKDEDRYLWRSPITPRWPSRGFPLPFRLPRVWTGVFVDRGKNRTNAATSTSSTPSTCLSLSTRRRKRTFYKWSWMASLMLVLTLAVYIAVVGVFKIHGYLVANGGGYSGVANGRNQDLVSRGRDIRRMNGKTVTTKQDGGVPGSAISTPTAQVSSVTAAAGPIWTRRTEVEMDDPIDFYPDEDEDDPSEAASFISWLAQASFVTPAIQQQDLQQHRPPQQYQEYHEPLRPSPSPSRPRQGEAGQESFLLEPDRYFTYMPFAGISNQFYGMLRAMSIARVLGRTLILPPITSSSHDKSRQNQAWSEFFDLDEFRRRTGLKVIEYQDLRDRGSFRGPTGVQESGSSVGASWIPPWVNEASVGEAAKATSSAEKRGGGKRYQQSLGTGTSAVDMTIPCHVTCGFGSKRDLDFTAKAFVRQWGFQYKKEMLPKSQSPSPATPAGSPVDNSPIDQTRDFDRIVGALQDDSLKGEGFLCVSNTYKIQISSAAIPVSSLVDSIEWREFGQHLLFQPRLTHFVDEFLGRTFGEQPEERAKYGNDTFWISPLPLSGPWSQPTPAPIPEQVHVLESVPPQGGSPQLQPPDQPIALDVVVDTLPSSPLAAPPVESQVSVSYAATVDLTPWPPLRPLIQHTFFMIHVRRGDFEAYCKKEFKDKRFDQCLPSNEAYARVINELQQRALRYNGSSDDGKNDGSGYNRILVGKDDEAVGRGGSEGRRRIPVLVATNENRPEELAQLRQLGRTRKAIRSAGVSNGNQREAVAGGSGSVIHDFERRKGEREEEEVEEGEEEGEEWIILDHKEMKTVERLGVFGPMMVEQLLMAEAEALVGVRMSTFSRVGGYRQLDWYQRRILYM